MTDDQLTPREIASELGVTVRTVQRWIADGRLPAERVGSRVRVSRSSLGGVSTIARPPQAAIRSVLVANRGEIAVRIVRTARRMGLRVVAVHAPDEAAPDGADEAHEISSYLDGGEILAVARAAGVEAIHPGYGFLAENPGFARAAIAAGLAWIGPPPEAIAAMGDKAAARRRAAELGVSVLPGYDGDDQGDAALAEAAGEIGFPLLVKPSAGGGGKGMRVVHHADDLTDALAGARREAARSFGDDRLILERFLPGPRHVEIQVLFDADGQGVHLGERDCSSQRRNQKIVEEAPAPGMTPELRGRMGEMALTVAGSVGYRGAGTVEMLLSDDGEAYFLEMNTRLQVEHPVTEAVTARDLVADQILVAGGATLEELGLRAAPPMHGHAIEARLYAEDPESGFLPASGVLALVAWPDGVRIDTAARAGITVSDRYDPMLAKLIAHGGSRAEAVERLLRALAETTVLGVRTNLRFLRWLLDQPVMRDGQMRTDTLASIPLPGPPTVSDAHWEAAGRALRPDAAGPWSDGWRLNSAPIIRVRHGDEERRVRVDTEPDDAAGEPAAIAAGGVAHVDVDGQSLEFALASAPTVDEAVRHAAAAGADATALLVAPMPGRVIAIRAVEGALVAAHEPLVVIEAMKMEHAVVAPHAGILRRVAVGVGQQVQRGDPLGEVAAYDGADG